MQVTGTLNPGSNYHPQHDQQHNAASAAVEETMVAVVIYIYKLLCGNKN